jgi:hypothetical protein
MNELQELLARCDPALDAPLTERESLRIRAAMLPARPADRPALRPAGAFALLLLLVLFVAALFTGARPERFRTAADQKANPATTRELQVTTPGGTRLIWIFRDGM